MTATKAVKEILSNYPGGVSLGVLQEDAAELGISARQVNQVLRSLKAQKLVERDVLYRAQAAKAKPPRKPKPRKPAAQIVTKQLQIIREHEPILSAEFAEKTGMSLTSASHRLSKLCALGLVYVSGSRKSTGNRMRAAFSVCEGASCQTA